MFQLDPSIAGRKRPYYCRCSLITFFLPCFYLPFQFFLARNPSIVRLPIGLHNLQDEKMSPTNLIWKYVMPEVATLKNSLQEFNDY